MFVGDVIGWLTDAEQWSGPDGIPTRLGQHLLISAVAMLIAAAVALPLGLFVGHRGRGGALVMNVSNIGRAIPTLALLGLLSLWLGFGSVWPTILALALLAIPPIVTNTYVGVRGADVDVVDAARGMGYAGRQVLWRVEAPLAAPLVWSGLRTSAVQVVATAALAALVAQGGLGRYVIDGLATGRYEELVGGAVLIAALAVTVDLAMGLLARLFDPMARARRRVAAARTA